VIWSLRRGAQADANPWGAGTLEWSVPSAPPPHNFDVLPVVHGRAPLWEPQRAPHAVAGLAAHAREVLTTSALDAQPDTRPLFPGPSIWPFLSAIATTIFFIGSIFTPSAVWWGTVPVAVAMIAWFWPGRRENRVARALERWPDSSAARNAVRRVHTKPSSREAASRDAGAVTAVLDVRALPSFGFSHRSLMWWATAGLMLIEGTLFAMTGGMYFYLRAVNPAWPMHAPPPSLVWGSLNTAVLLASLWPNQLAKRAAERGDRERARLWLAVCLAFAFAFLVVRGVEFGALNVMWYANSYGSIAWLLLGLHTTHLITDTVDTAVLTTLLYSGPFEKKRLLDTSENAVYWYFVVLSWLPIYAVIYLVPRMPP
jgi:cytochrome c oxidase subunit 1/cytochrome c oxidase subunit I+III